ncbi:importin, partial [Haematococcus lacustris]
AVAPYVSQLLQALHPLFGPKEAAGTRDNAAGCVGRLLLAAPPAQPLVPVDAVLPVLLGALPPSEDLGEAAPAYRALAHLLLAG